MSAHVPNTYGKQKRKPQQQIPGHIPDFGVASVTFFRIDQDEMRVSQGTRGQCAFFVLGIVAQSGVLKAACYSSDEIAMVLRRPIWGRTKRKQQSILPGMITSSG